MSIYLKGLQVLLRQTLRISTYSMKTMTPTSTSHCGLRSSFIVHFTSTTPPKTPGGSTVRNFYAKFDFQGLGCDHAVLEQLEAKNLLKRATCCQKQPFFRGFLLLVALNLHGRTPYSQIIFLGLFPIYRPPLGTHGWGAS